MTGQDEIAPTTVSVNMPGVLAYEFRKYARTMQMTHSHLVRAAVEEYLAKRGIATK